MDITLIRHGETPWNSLGKVQGQADIPLSDLGIQQAQKLHFQMQSQLSTYTAIYTSPMQRASQTAHILQGSSKIPIIADDRLNSRNLGDYSGRTLEDIRNQSPATFALWRNGDPSFRPPNGESIREMIDKLQAFLTFLSMEYPPDSKYFIVTHRESVGALMNLLGTAPNDVLTGISNCVPYHFSFN